jgi:UDP-glucose 4-epimerase
VSINAAAPVDSRSYRVDFSLFERLAPQHRPQFSLERSIQELVQLLDGKVAGGRERFAELIRLNVLQQHLEAARLSPDLEWIDA